VGDHPRLLRLRPRHRHRSPFPTAPKFPAASRDATLAVASLFPLSFFSFVFAVSARRDHSRPCDQLENGDLVASIAASNRARPIRNPQRCPTPLSSHLIHSSPAPWRRPDLCRHSRRRPSPSHQVRAAILLLSSGVETIIISAVCSNQSAAFAYWNMLRTVPDYSMFCLRYGTPNFGLALERGAVPHPQKFSSVVVSSIRLCTLYSVACILLQIWWWWRCCCLS
jgi:hypothetical protein